MYFLDEKEPWELLYMKRSSASEKSKEEQQQ